MGRINNTNLAVRLGRMHLRTPIVMASGTFGYGTELKKLVDYRKIGAIITKTITLHPWCGNPQPRIWETSGGLLNSIGLQNPGWTEFRGTILPLLKNLGPKLLVSIGGNTVEELCGLAGLVSREKVAGLELNISCPNLLEKKTVISQDPGLTFKTVRAVKKACGQKPLWVKLSPNVTSIAGIAAAAEEAGADAVNLINTVKGLGLDLEKNKIVLGGLSGPAIKPVGLRQVYEVYQAVKIPIVGTGGIYSGTDALEYFLIGASAISIGSGIFSNPGLVTQVYDFLAGYMKKNKVPRLAEIVGKMNEKKRLACF